MWDALTGGVYDRALRGGDGTYGSEIRQFMTFVMFVALLAAGAGCLNLPGFHAGVVGL